MHAVTQKRWATCADDEQDEKTRKSKRTSWIIHLLLASGYGLMLVLIIFFLSWFQTDEIYPLYHPQRWLGYYATIVLLLGGGTGAVGANQKRSRDAPLLASQRLDLPRPAAGRHPDRNFAARFPLLGLPLATYYTYVVHLAFTAPMLILEVPFGKWAHLYYRPLAIYFQAVKEKAAQIQEEIPAGAVASAAD